MWRRSTGWGSGFESSRSSPQNGPPRFPHLFWKVRENEKESMTETRMKSRLFTSRLGEKIIFGMETQRQAAAPKTRTSFLWGALFFVPALCSGYLFCQHFSGGKLPLPRRELHFCEVRAFSCPRLWFQALPPSSEVIGSFSRLFLFFAVPSEPKSLGSLIYEPSLPQKR